MHHDDGHDLLCTMALFFRLTFTRVRANGTNARQRHVIAWSLRGDSERQGRMAALAVLSTAVGNCACLSTHVSLLEIHCTYHPGTGSRVVPQAGDSLVFCVAYYS